MESGYQKRLSEIQELERKLEAAKRALENIAEETDTQRCHTIAIRALLDIFRR